MTKFVPGSKWLTRDGRKALIMADVGDVNPLDGTRILRPLIGFVEESFGLTTWPRGGQFMAAGIESLDLVSPLQRAARRYHDVSSAVRKQTWRTCTGTISKPGNHANVFFPHWIQNPGHPRNPSSSRGRRDGTTGVQVVNNCDTETRERRAASFLIGVAAGLAAMPRGVSKRFLKTAQPMFEELANHIYVANEIHLGNGWANPLQIWDMVRMAESLGFKSEFLYVKDTVIAACNGGVEA